MMEQIIQGSPEWFAVRCGKVTASRIADLTARSKTGWYASRANYMAELLIERLTGQCAPSYENDAMRWGKEQEPQARAEYAFRYNVDVAEVGFVQHPAIEMSGASPDGLIGEIGLVEIKCPSTATHVDTLLSQSVPEKYIKQMQWQMACAGRAWCDFVSFDPRMPEHMQVFVQRVPRDEKLITSLEKDVTDFLAELDAKIDALRSRYDRKDAA